MKRVLVMACLLLASATASAQPVISGTSGTLTHGSSVTINGTNFGIKTVAPQKIWDRGEGTSVGALWDDWQPTTAADPSCNIAYRTVIRGVALPHSTSNTKYLAGCHYGLDNSTGGNLVYVSDSRTVPSYPYYSYWAYYWREDPAWSNSFGENTDGNNKIHVISNDASLLGNVFWYNEYDVRPTTPSVIPQLDVSDTGSMGYRCRVAVVGACHSDGSGHVGFGPNGLNPINGWIKQEILIRWDRANTGYVIMYQNGLKVFHTTGETDMSTTGPMRWEAIGLYSRARGITTFRYFDDIYFDTGVDAMAHVELCPGSTFANRGTCQTQPLTTWSASSIGVTLNRGALAANSTAYVYVTDRTRATNANGFAVTLGSSGATTPVAPTGLRLADLSIVLGVFAGLFMLKRRDKTA